MKKIFLAGFILLLAAPSYAQFIGIKIGMPMRTPTTQYKQGNNYALDDASHKVKDDSGYYILGV